MVYLRTKNKESGKSIVEMLMVAGLMVTIMVGLTRWGVSVHMENQVLRTAVHLTNQINLLAYSFIKGKCVSDELAFTKLETKIKREKLILSPKSLKIGPAITMSVGRHEGYEIESINIYQSSSVIPGNKAVAHLRVDIKGTQISGERRSDFHYEVPILAEAKQFSKSYRVEACFERLQIAEVCVSKGGVYNEALWKCQ